jgi:hypothetical protein
MLELTPPEGEWSSVVVGVYYISQSSKCQSLLGGEGGGSQQNKTNVQMLGLVFNLICLHGAATLSLMAFNINILFSTLRITDTKHNNTLCRVSSCWVSLGWMSLGWVSWRQLHYFLNSKTKLKVENSAQITLASFRCDQIHNWLKYNLSQTLLCYLSHT